MAEQCGATRKDGRQCTARPRPGVALCWAHDPATATKRKHAHAASGQNRATVKRLERAMLGTLRPILDILYGALVGLEAGTVEPRTAVAMASVAGAITKMYEVATLQAQMDQLTSVLEPERTKLVRRR